jgi:hypothetical protein
MKKLILSVAILGGLLAFSSAGFAEPHGRGRYGGGPPPGWWGAKPPCSTVHGRPRPTQFHWGRWANCTCRFPIDCEVRICQFLPRFRRRCDISPSSFFPDPDPDQTAIPATFLTDPDPDPADIPATF